MTRTPRRHVLRIGGFTLLELLATTVLLGLVVGTVSLRWASSGEAARRQAAVAAVRDLDSRARLLGRSGVLALLRTESESTRAVIHDALSGELLAAVDLPNGSTVRFAVPDLHQQEILFDRTGRSPSYRVELRSVDWERAWTVSGATGWVMEETP